MSALAAAWMSVVLLAEPGEQAKKMDALFAHRDDPATLKEAQAYAAEVTKANPSSYELAWRAAKLQCWVAETSPSDEAKKAAAKLAWDMGDHARGLDPKSPEGQYYAAAGVGLFGQAMGIMTAISAGVDGKFNERLDKAIQIDPMIESGGPYVARGRYYYEVPFFMRDLKKSADFLGKVVAKHPENLRAHWYLAQTLLKNGDAKKAKVEIDAVMAGDESYDGPEARWVKQRAKQAQKDIADALR